jgi:mannose-6-phosphate isomerase-like protein (cupin superfamily)
MISKVNLESKLRSFDGFFSPKIVARMNDYKIAVVKTKGEFVWHKHDDTDDFFRIQLRGNEDVGLGPGELFVVPKGMEHCPRADEETHILLIEPAGTVNTGDAGGELTALEETI